jgi:hypothetical protein
VIDCATCGALRFELPMRCAEAVAWEQRTTSAAQKTLRVRSFFTGFS